MDQEVFEAVNCLCLFVREIFLMQAALTEQALATVVAVISRAGAVTEVIITLLSIYHLYHIYLLSNVSGVMFLQKLC